jgi:hypothetical protein
MGNPNDAISSYFIKKTEARIEKENWFVVLNLYYIFFFGRKVIILKFKLNRCHTPVCCWAKSAIKSFLVTSQNIWWNSVGNPFGPGALLCSIWEIASNTSSSLKFDVRIPFCSSESCDISRLYPLDRNYLEPAQKAFYNIH